MILISILLLRKSRRCRDECISNRKQNRLWIQSEDSSPATHSLRFLNNGIPLLSECFMCFNFITNRHSEHYYCLTHVVTDALRHPVTCWDSTAGPGDIDLPRVVSGWSLQSWLVHPSAPLPSSPVCARLSLRPSVLHWNVPFSFQNRLCLSLFPLKMDVESSSTCLPNMSGFSPQSLFFFLSLRAVKSMCTMVTEVWY